MAAEELRPDHCPNTPSFLKAVAHVCFTSQERQKERPSFGTIALQLSNFLTSLTPSPNSVHPHLDTAITHMNLLKALCLGGCACALVHLCIHTVTRP